MGVDPYLVNASVIGVIAQRLVRMLCPECRRPCEQPLHSMPPEAAAFVQQNHEAGFHSPVGC